MDNKESKFFKFISGIDFYGINFPFRYRKKSYFPTKLGILLSIFTLIFSIIFAIIYFLDMVNRKSFGLYSYEEKIIKDIDFSDIPVIIGIQNFLGETKLIDKNYIEISLYNSIYKTVDYNTKLIGNISKRIELEKCDKYFNSLNESFKNEINNKLFYYNLSNYLCIKKGQNFEISGKFGDVLFETKIIEIYINKCNNSISDNSCKNEQEINEYLNDLYFTIIFLEKTIEHQNYKNPIGNGYKSEYFGIHPNILKKVIFSYQPGIYKSDNGFLFSNIKEYLFYEYKEKYIDFVKEDKLLNNNLSIFQIIISSMDYVKIYKRSYLKITDICANIGGWIDFLFILFKFITQYFSHKTLTVDISSHLISKKCKMNINLKCVDNNNKKISKFQSEILNHNSSIFSIKKEINIKKINSLNSNNHLNVQRINNNYKKNNAIENKNLYRLDNNSKKKSFTLSTNDFGNIILNKYLNEALLKKGKYHNQKDLFSFYDYIIPFICLKKYSKYNLLLLYNNVVKSFLNLEQYLPMVEGFSKYYREDERYREKFKSSIFKIQEYDEL